MRWLSAQGTRLSQPQGAARGTEAGFFWAAGAQSGGVGLGGKAYTASATTTIGAVPFVGSKTFTVIVVLAAPTASTASAEALRIGGASDGIRLDIGTTGGGINPIRWTANGVANLTSQIFNISAFSTAPMVSVASFSGSNAEVWTGATAPAGGIEAGVQYFSQSVSMATPTTRTVQIAGGAARHIYGVVVLPRRVSGAEARQIVANPWQLFASERRIWVPVSASGGGSSTNLVIQSALHAHTADGPTLTTDSALAIADALHAHSSDAPTLSTDLLLSVADASHAHAAEALTLDIGTALLVADATHAHAADGLALTTDSFLAVADALHGHAADNLTLTADGAVDLVIQDALHAHTADELTLTVTGAGGYYDDDPKRAPRKREKLTVIHKDDSDERSQEFEALLARVKGQALDKAKSAAQAAPVATPPADIKPPRMPEIRGVEASLLRQWMPDLLSTYRATFTAELQALASAQQAAAQAQFLALQRQQYDDEEIAILAMLA